MHSILPESKGFFLFSKEEAFFVIQKQRRDDHDYISGS
ncbi:hypothetical protein CHCC20335_1229 [Bacillus paralicheniformis]|nr:hypothetical protein CHCC20335_1229 [Bacillus paralicheniformis]